MKLAKYTGLLVLSLSFFLSAGCKGPQGKETRQETKEIPLLIITDFGRDVDDAQAFAFLARYGVRDTVRSAGTGETIYGRAVPKIAGIITTGYIPAVRAASLELFLNYFGISVPIAVGKAFPGISAGNEANDRYSPRTDSSDSLRLEAYLASHSLDGEPYEITLLKKLASDSLNKELAGKIPGLQEMIPAKGSYIPPIKKITSARIENGVSSRQLIDSLINLYPDELRVLVLAQPTDLADYIGVNREQAGKFHSVYIQGQSFIGNIENNGTVAGKMLSPNFEAYNLREDTASSRVLFSLQDEVPFLFLGKYAAYPLAFTREETDTIAMSYGPAGEYLRDAAYMGLRSFLQREPDLFYKIFKIAPDIPACRAIDSLRVLNNPYDLLTALAIMHPELFYIRDREGRLTAGGPYRDSSGIVHSFIGNIPEDQGIREAKKIKSLFLSPDGCLFR